MDKTMPKIIGLLASTSSGCIGKNQKLPWHCSAETAYFRDMITDQVIIVGHKTYRTLPESTKNLCKKIIVFSRQYQPQSSVKNIFFVNNLDTFLAIVREQNITSHTSIPLASHQKANNEQQIATKIQSELAHAIAGPYVFMIGGAEITEFFLQKQLIDYFLLSIMHDEYQGDVFFPIQEIKLWPTKLLHKDQEFSIYLHQKPKNTT